MSDTVIIETTTAEVVVVEVAEQGPQGPPGTGAVNLRIDVVANIDIPAYSPVLATGYIADSTIVANRNKIVGIAFTSVTTGLIVPVVTTGEVTNNAWAWVAGDLIFLNGTGLSKTPPTIGFVQQLGKAINSNTIIVELKQAILI